MLYRTCYSISSLKNLEIMDISHTHLSEGLIDNIFTSLLSLRELYMRECKLPALANRCVLYYDVKSYCTKYNIYIYCQYNCVEIYVFFNNCSDLYQVIIFI